MLTAPAPKQVPNSRMSTGPSGRPVRCTSAKAHNHIAFRRSEEAVDSNALKEVMRVLPDGPEPAPKSRISMGSAAPDATKVPFTSLHGRRPDRRAAITASTSSTPWATGCCRQRHAHRIHCPVVRVLSIARKFGLPYFCRVLGRLAQLVQSISFTPRGPGVRVPHRPPHFAFPGNRPANRG